MSYWNCLRCGGTTEVIRGCPPYCQSCGDDERIVGPFHSEDAAIADAIDHETTVRLGESEAGD